MKHRLVSLFNEWATGFGVHRLTCSGCSRRRKVRRQSKLCYDCSYDAETRAWREHVAEHGYPPSFSLEEGRKLLQRATVRMHRLQNHFKDVPEVILRNESRLIEKRRGYLQAWLKDHPEDLRFADFLSTYSHETS